MKPKSSTEYSYQKYLELRAQGWTMQAIANEFGIERCTLYNKIKRNEKGHSPNIKSDVLEQAFNALINSLLQTLASDAISPEKAEEFRQKAQHIAVTMNDCIYDAKKLSKDVDLYLKFNPRESS